MGPKLVIRDAIIISAKGLVVMQVKNLKIILEDNTCKLSYYHFFCIVIHHAYNDAKIVK